jgi:O-antigen/teichoic acid export membrane protein
LVFVRHSDFFDRFRKLPSPTDGFSWGRDVVPMQWRVALISVAQYLSSQLFVAVIVGRDSAESAADAGRLGATLTMTTAIQMLALAWVQTKFSLVSAHHGAGERETAGTMWRQTALVSTALLCLALGTLTGLIAVMPLMGRGWELRFLVPWQLAVLAVGLVANHLLAVQSFYVMSRRANPLWIPSVVGLLATAAAVWVFGRMYSTGGLVIAYSVATALVALPLHSWAYLRYRREE